MSGSLPEKGAAGDAVEELVRLSLGWLGQGEHLLLGDAGGDGHVSLVERVEVLVVRGHGAGVAHSWKER